MEGNRYKKGLWTVEEDRVLMEYIQAHGKGRWNRIAKMTGLKRCGKSCRLRWMNYLCPNIKRGKFSEEEDDLIIRLHNLLGNRWSLIAGRVPGRTDNQVKNHWNSHLSKKMRAEEPKSNEMLSSLPLSKASEEENLTCELPSNGATGEVCGPQMKGDHQKGCGSQELAMDDYDNGSSYWLFDDNLLYLNAPIWKELIDAYPLDVAWHEF